MTRDEIAAVLAEELSRIAPEISFDEADRGEDLRDAFEIDSMDFLNLVTALHKRLGVDIPEADYDWMATLDKAIDYLASRLD
jgi:acyl carrier protein